VVSFNPPTALPQGIGHWYPLDRRLGALLKDSAQWSTGKVPLFATEYHATTAYWSGGIAPRILDLATR